MELFVNPQEEKKKAYATPIGRVLQNLPAKIEAKKATTALEWVSKEGACEKLTSVVLAVVHLDISFLFLFVSIIHD